MKTILRTTSVFICLLSMAFMASAQKSVTPDSTWNTTVMAPQCVPSASPASVAQGQTSTISVSCGASTNPPNQYRWNVSNGGPAAAGASSVLTFPSVGVYCYVVRGASIDGFGKPSSATCVTVTAAVAPAVCSISASPGAVQVGQTASLSAGCTNIGANPILWGNPGGAPAFAGAGGTGTFNSIGTFTYSVQGYNGTSYGAPSFATVVVSAGPPPVCTITATPASIQPGQSSTLTASCTNVGANPIIWTNPVGAPSFAGLGGTGTFGTIGAYTYAVQGFDGTSYGAPTTVTVNVAAAICPATTTTAGGCPAPRSVGLMTTTTTYTGGTCTPTSSTDVATACSCPAGGVYDGPSNTCNPPIVYFCPLPFSSSAVCTAPATGTFTRTTTPTLPFPACALVITDDSATACVAPMTQTYWLQNYGTVGVADQVTGFCATTTTGSVISCRLTTTGTLFCRANTEAYKNEYNYGVYGSPAAVIAAYPATVNNDSTCTAGSQAIYQTPTQQFP